MGSGGGLQAVPPSVYEAARAHLTTQIDPDAWAWLERDAVHAQLDTWLAEQDQRCRDPAWAAQFRRHCPVPGAQDADYAQHWVPVDGGWALVGVRMRGEQVDAPFVDLLATSEPLAWSSVLRAGIEAYAPFAAVQGRVRLGQPPDDPALVHHVDQYYLAAPVAQLREGPCDVTLIALDDSERGHAYVLDTFAAWSASRPWIAERVHPITQADLEQAMERGVAAWIEHQGMRVGLIATLPNTDREWHGHTVWEEVVHPDHSGHGFAAQAQRALARQLDGVLFGTIDAANLPSLRTAEAAGRKVVGAFHWVAARDGVPD